jgi:hypothetical protein
MRSFHYLHYGFASIIVVLGLKMLLGHVYDVPIGASLGIIVGILTVAIIASLLRPRREDLKRLLDRSERRGLLSFRRLLLLEKVFDLGSERVRGTMRPRPEVEVVRVEASWPENREIIVRSRFSRYPLVRGAAEQPLGFEHVKDLLYLESPPRTPDEWMRLARPFRAVGGHASLEELLVELQRHQQQMALVFDEKGTWAGLVTLEDVIEAIVGNVGDEFEVPSMAIPSLMPAGVTLGLEAETLDEPVTEIIDRAGTRGGRLPPGVPQTVVRGGSRRHPISRTASPSSPRQQPRSVNPSCCSDGPGPAYLGPTTTSAFT